MLRVAGLCAELSSSRLSRLSEEAITLRAWNTIRECQTVEGLEAVCGDRIVERIPDCHSRH